MLSMLLSRLILCIFPLGSWQHMLSRFFHLSTVLSGQRDEQLAVAGKCCRAHNKLTTGSAVTLSAAICHLHPSCIHDLTDALSCNCLGYGFSIHRHICRLRVFLQTSVLLRTEVFVSERFPKYVQLRSCRRQVGMRASGDECRRIE